MHWHSSRTQRWPLRHHDGATVTVLLYSPPLTHPTSFSPHRSLKAHDRKVRKAAAKHNLDLARRLARHKPGYRLDHLVKER